MVTARRRQVPQVVRVACMLTDQVGDAVYIRSAMNGVYKVARADVGLYSKMPAIGVITKKWGFTEALVQLWGEVAGIYTGLTPGRTYFIDSAGKPTLVPPDPALTGGRAYLQVIGVALDVGVLLVKPAENPSIRVA